MSQSNGQLIEKMIGEQLFDYLERNPGDYDVTFCVGPEKKVVKAVKMILKAASPVLEKEFNDNWENGVLETGEGIPLPDFDPIPFELFIKLLIQDRWCQRSLKALNLSLDVLLNLRKICRYFGVSKGITNVDELISVFIRSLDAYAQTDDFLKLSCKNLETVISSEEIQSEERAIFEYACKWAEFQCSERGMEPTSDNLRQILGKCLFRIRYPLMSTADFSKVCRFKSNLLNQDEKVTVFEFIGMDQEEKEAYDKTQLPFDYEPRTILRMLAPNFEGSVLSLAKNLEIVESPPFMCTGAPLENYIQICKEKIALHGIAFFGPIDEDSYYTVTVEIKRVGNTSQAYSSGTMEKRLFARQQNLFYFIFDEPITLEPIADDGSAWDSSDRYFVVFSLKGPKTMSAQRSCAEDKKGMVEENGVKFRFFWYTGESQCAAYLYEKL